MPIIEFTERAACEAFVKNAGRRIRSMSLYWYEGSGTRKTTVLAGSHVKAHLEPLSFLQRLHECFDGSIALDEAFKKDFEENGGMTELTGRPEDAVFVIEYDDPQ